MSRKGRETWGTHIFVSGQIENLAIRYHQKNRG